MDADYAVPPPQNRALKTSSHLEKKNNVEQDEIKLYMLARLQPSPITRYGAQKPPQWIYHITNVKDWMRYSDVYVGDENQNRKSPLIKCVDEDRLDALVSRKFYRAHYEQAIDDMNALSERMYRGFLSFFMRGYQNAVEVVESKFGAKYTKRPSMTCREQHMYEDTNLLLIVIYVTTFDLNEQLVWTPKLNYPHLHAAIDKNRDNCFEYALRYDKRTLRVALPSQKDLDERTEAVIARHYQN